MYGQEATINGIIKNADDTTMNKKILILLLLISINLYSFENFSFHYEEGEIFKIIIRSNYKIYKNSKYEGLHTRELKGIYKVTHISNDIIHAKADVYVVDKTIRGTSVLPGIIDVMDTLDISWDAKGNVVSTSGYPFPPLLGIPSFPDTPMENDSIYEKEAVYYEDFDKVNGIKKYPVRFTMVYKGIEDLNGEKLNYFEQFFNVSRDESNLKVRGLHSIRLFFDGNKGRPVYMEDKFEDLYVNDKETVSHKGFYLYFYSRVNSLRKKEIVNQTKIDAKDGYVTETDKGVTITLNNLHFKPDSTEIVEDDIGTLDNVYNVLKSIEHRTFMIIGHTADTGNPEAEKQLSLDRALSIAEFLQHKGISRERLLYTGKGASEPIVPNDTEDNKKKNRRVEIIILED